MNRLVTLSLIALLIASDALAQSGSTSRPAYRPQGSATTGSSTAPSIAPRQAKLALDGYCAVCRVEMNDWQMGSPQYQTEFDGRLYRFPGTDQMAIFQKNPAKYVPALGGDDVVEFARSGRRVAGKTAYGATLNGRYYFFSTAANKETFRADPSPYADIDLALSGACVVCQVDMNQSMPGNPQFTALHQGMRYQFIGAQQQQAFLEDPARYASRSRGTRPLAPAPSAGSGSGGR